MTANHAHHHAPPSHDRAFAIGIALNVGFVALEAFYGWKIDSLALLADAGHNLSDVAGLVLAWVGAVAGRLRPDARHTYGWKRASILAAFINALVLLIVMGALIWEALQRLDTPAPVQGVTIMWVAGIGIIINSATALLFVRGSKHDLNIRGAFLHMTADALISAGVVVAGAVTVVYGLLWVDPVVSLAIAAIIIVGTWSLFKQSTHLLFDGVPDGVELVEVHAFLNSLNGVQEVRDLHVWAMGTTDIALIAHLVIPGGQVHDAFVRDASDLLRERFAISHVTMQIMHEPFGPNCSGTYTKI